MPCHSCGRTGEPLHSGEWVSAKSATEKYSTRSAIPNMTLYVTRTTYSDPTELHLALCLECLARHVQKSSRKQFVIVAIIFAVLTAIGLVAISPPKAGTALRVGFGAFMALSWIAVLGGYQHTSRRLRRGNLLPVDEPFFHDYARTVNRQAGRDALFSLAEWRALVENSGQIQYDDKPLNPEAIRTAVSRVVQGVVARPNSET